MERAYVRTDRFHTGRTDIGWFLLHGAVGGVIAGIIFSAVGLLVAAAMGQTLLEPAQAVAAPYVGDGAVAGTAIPVAILAMFLYSLGAGLLFGLIMSPIASLTPGGAIIASTLMGLVVGMVYYFLMNQTYGWEWFPSDLHPLAQIGMFGLFGFMVGLYLAAIAPAPTVVEATDVHTESRRDTLPASTPQQTVIVDRPAGTPPIAGRTTHSHGDVTHSHADDNIGHTHR